MTRDSLPSHVFNEIRNTSEAIFLSDCYIKLYECSLPRCEEFEGGDFLYMRIVKNDVLIYTYFYASWARFLEELPYFQRSTREVEAIINECPPFDLTALSPVIGFLPNLRSDTRMKFFPHKMTPSTRANFDNYFFEKSFEKIK
jgi:hypothetical protein